MRLCSGLTKKEDEDMRSIFRRSMYIVFVAVVVALNGCGSTSTTSNTTSCAAGSNDFYVVENASCVAAAGKLSRVNPDAVCKEEILTGLNCPVDFVLSTMLDNIGYISSRTDGIYQVNLAQKTKTHIVTVKNIVSPAGLFLLENLTHDEKTVTCGNSQALVDAILMVADEGTDPDGGIIWLWCLISNDPTILSDGSNPSPIWEIGPAQILHPRGVVIKNRTQVFATGLRTDVVNTSQAALATWELASAETIVPDFLTSAGDFSSDIKDVALDSDGNVLVADPGQNAVFRYDTTAGTLTALQPSLTGGPRDVIPSGAAGTYWVTQFDDGVVSATTFVNGSTPTTVTTGITLSGPDGIAK